MTPREATVPVTPRAARPAQPREATAAEAPHEDFAWLAPLVADVLLIRMRNDERSNSCSGRVGWLTQWLKQGWYELRIT